MKNSISVLLLEDGTSGPFMRMSFGLDERLKVYDIHGRANATIRASELSLYRHAVMLKGRVYKILNIVMPLSLARAA